MHKRHHDETGHSSETMITTCPSLEALNQIVVAKMMYPVQSIKGKVGIDAFRLINPQTMTLGQESRQTTYNVCHLNKPSSKH